MPRIKASYTLYPRPRKNGKPVWYYQTYDEKGRRTPGRSTGTTKKTEAQAYCDALLRGNRLNASKAPTLSAWVAEQHYFEWAKESATPLCRYAKNRLARSSKERPGVGKEYIRTLHRCPGSP
jgi:hypothetical protein